MRILYVEDDLSVVQSVQVMLETEGHSCDATDSGKRAVELAKAGKYDIILLDIMLPDIDGYEVIKRLRAAGVRTPILIQTGLVGDGIRHDGLSLGVSQYLVKPFNKVELIERIQGMVSGAGRRVPSDTAVQQGAADSPQHEGDERRQHRRFETTLPATILHNSGIDCIILNMSYGGAALQLPSPDTNCPPVFDLQIAFGSKFRCKVCWRFQDKIGVKGEAGWTEGLLAAQSDHLAPAVAEQPAPKTASSGVVPPSRFGHEDQPSADPPRKPPVERQPPRAPALSHREDPPAATVPAVAAGQEAAQVASEAAGQAAEPETAATPGEAAEPPSANAAKPEPTEVAKLEAAEAPSPAAEPEAAVPAPAEAPSLVAEPEVAEPEVAEPEPADPAPVETAPETIEPTPAPAMKPPSAPAIQPAPAPAIEPAPAPAIEPAPAPTFKPAPAPAIEPAPAPAFKPTPVETIEPAPTPALEPAPAPVPAETHEASVAEAPAARPDIASRPAQAASDRQTFVVDVGVRLVAETLECSELLVKGHLEAIVRAERLRIAPGGRIVGSAETGAADVAGRFEGTLKVAGKLAIGAAGAVSGRTHYDEIIIAPGGQISGEIQRSAADGATGLADQAKQRPVAVAAAGR